MIYFCPIYGNWVEYSSDDNLDYSGYWPPRNIRAEVTDQTIIDKWNTVSPPPAPELKSVAVDPKTSALLILDMEPSICKSPSCIASIPNIHNLLTKARKNNMLVVYSLTHSGNPRDIFKQLAPLPSDPIVKSNVDKFYKTNLEKILQEKGIKTVVVTGYAANGAVLHTGTSAAFRGYNVIIPVDCMSANNLYAEQYTAWHMLNSPGTRNRAVLTKVDLISFYHDN
ncbi:cysteine hydrolase [Clostridium botulinum]|uniref:Cysteine hydrolase n=1 Tax=Clostridium botulinum TaxID=1491 RepID=A0A6B4GS41_CLOBO|nr:cysteine hydrolase [Clostridium botulinum]KRU25073.1 isochorismatase hydrolase [Clostridium sporogenes]KRU31964.1 isochorismatase hydrolase [Clostridium sporogenes]KRU34234.1 isochorismatase hydrolase [Clostridium sporogenes]KRU41251.1 isochorismatase hydrolase [Clostridium sporogenes]MBZ1328166.1 cysteine hydrolase [Clostridium botulinum]